MEQQSSYAAQEAQNPVEDLIHQKGRILKTKLEVLALEIRARFHIRSHNLERIDSQREQIVEEMTNPSCQSHYLTSRFHVRVPFHEQLFDLETQRRSEDVECWRDVVNVMRDFLVVWEAHEQAKAKAIFFNNYE